ncbi:MAG: Phosphatidate cytidylyltransferase [Ktedonobacterales bacterium]|jgi:phosphatidate cytidylyltransferase|nr:MAG: Phosphatidate cytidylyltransferase [Ktedonobacterales bacterium]
MSKAVGATKKAAASGSANSTWLSALGQRALTALVLIPIVIALIFFGGWVAFAGAVVALAIGVSELHVMYRHDASKGWRPLTALIFGMGLLFLIAARVLILAANPLAVLAILALGISALIVLSFGWLLLTNRPYDHMLTDWALTMGSAFYLGWPLAGLLVLRGDTLGAASAGFWWLLALFFMAWANDTFALLTGHYFGRHKLAPHVSPAKTWEGFYGGLVFTVIAAFVFLMGLPTLFGHALPVRWWDAIILGILVALAATVGDLAESLLKRATGVKDSGTIMPGHGGILDRMDSLLFVILVVLFYAAALHGIPL